MRLPRYYHASGFTVVELLIVVVVIAILAAIIIVTYSGVQTNAKASAIISGLKSSEKALNLYATDQNLSAWPADSAAVPGISTNPTIQQYINGTSLKDFMKQAPNVANSPSLTWFYDNDSDTRTGCTLKYAGTNIIIIGVDQTVADSIDKSIDDNNEGCGRVRYDTTNQYFFYSLSYGSTIGSL
jgi:prepilin-type N-terminal cleavage/methylation domain-containing protein